MRILIVEDEPMILAYLEDALEEAGFSVTGAAASLTRGLEMVAQAKFDVAILDTNLDGKSSAPIAEALRAREIPFMIISGYSESQLPNGLAGAPCVTKPFRIPEISKILTRLVPAAARAQDKFV
jgi:DNA-binding response OmpR family regulator